MKATKEQEIERIGREVIKILTRFSKPNDTPILIEKLNSIIVSEHDKASNQTIQEAKEKVKGLRNSVGENEYGKTYFDIAYTSVIIELESLKTKLALHETTPQTKEASKEEGR